MNLSNIEVFSNRLIQGEDPLVVFTEIEYFYVIRENLNRLNPGMCLYGPDEYDSAAYFILDHLLQAFAEDRLITNRDLAIVLRNHFREQFNGVFDEKFKNLDIFTRDLFLDLTSTSIFSPELKKKGLCHILVTNTP